MNLCCLLFFLFNPFVNSNEMFVEDLQKIFEEKHCIEASQMSIPSFENTNIMVEKESIKNPLKQIPLLINITEVTKMDLESDKNVLSKINELAQYNELQYTYELISEEGPPHQRIFKILLKLGDEKYEGQGSSLKQAQREAAALALANTAFEQPPIKLQEQVAALTPTVILNNIATKLGLAVSYTLINEKDEKEITNYSPTVSTKKTYFQKLNDSIYHPNKDSLRVPTEEAQVSGPFTVRVKVGESIFVGFGHTIQGARHDAATNAIKNIEKEILLRNNYCSKDETVELCKEKKESLKSAISRIYEAGQKHNLPVEFDIISETGKQHKKLFIMRCKLGEFFTEGEGESKKSAKQQAAEKMLENISKLPEIIDGKEIISEISPKKKNKKKKINKANTNTISHNINTILDSFWGANEINLKEHAEKEPSAAKSSSPKDRLLDIGNLLKIEVHFSDLSLQRDEFISLVSLGVNPTHICLGKGSTVENSHFDAALHALKFLHQAGLLKNQINLDYDEKSYFVDDYEIDEENIVYTSAEKEAIKK